MALIDPVMLKTRLGALAGRFDVDALDECDSTNSELMRRASGRAIRHGHRCRPAACRTGAARAELAVVAGNQPDLLAVLALSR
jgi:hypothetical protein